MSGLRAGVVPRAAAGTGPGGGSLPEGAGERVAAVRAFNRFYTNVIGVLHQGLLDTPYSLTEARVIFELAHRDATELVDLRRRLSRGGRRADPDHPPDTPGWPVGPGPGCGSRAVRCRPDDRANRHRIPRRPRGAHGRAGGIIRPACPGRRGGQQAAEHPAAGHPVNSVRFADGPSVARDVPVPPLLRVLSVQPHGHDPPLVADKG
jgi:hypothetical protein